MGVKGVAMALACLAAGCLEAPPATGVGEDGAPGDGPGQADGGGGDDAGPPVANLVARYPFDEVNRGTVDDVAGEHDATCSACPLETQGHIDGALQFAAFSHLVIVDRPSLRLEEATVSLWIQLDQLFGYTAVIGKAVGVATNNTWEIYLSNTGEVLFQSTPGGTIASSYALVIGEWVHVAATWTVGRQELFVEGTSRAVGDEAAAPMFDDNPIMVGVGSDNGSQVNPLYGALDEILFFDRVLTADEIAGLASTPPILP